MHGSTNEKNENTLFGWKTLAKATMTMAASGDRDVLCRIFHFSIRFIHCSARYFCFRGRIQGDQRLGRQEHTNSQKCTHQTTNETNWNAKRAKWLNRRQPTTTYRIVQNEALCAQRAIQTPTRPTGNGNYSEHKILATHVYGRSGILRYNNCVWDAIGAQSTETNSGATTNTAAAAETMQEKSKWDTRLYIYKYMWTMCPFHGTGISIYIYIRFK